MDLEKDFSLKVTLLFLAALIATKLVMHIIQPPVIYSEVKLMSCHPSHQIQMMSCHEDTLTQGVLLGQE